MNADMPGEHEPGHDELRTGGRDAIEDDSAVGRRFGVDQDDGLA